MLVPGEPQHTVHGVALERGPADSGADEPPAFARAHADVAFKVLVTVMKDEEVTASTRVAAATEILDRTLGKARPASDDDAHQTQRIELIRRIIVDPRLQHSESVHPALPAGPV